MIVQVQLFAGAREAAGADSVEVELEHDATFEDLAGAVVAGCPALTALMPAARFAADSEYASPGHRVKPNTEIALIPAVSGG